MNDDNFNSLNVFSNSKLQGVVTDSKSHNPKILGKYFYPTRTQIQSKNKNKVNNFLYKTTLEKAPIQTYMTAPSSIRVSPR